MRISVPKIATFLPTIFGNPGYFLVNNSFFESPDIQGRGRHHHGFWSLLSTTRRSPARGKSYFQFVAIDDIFIAIIAIFADVKHDKDQNL